MRLFKVTLITLVVCLVSIPLVSCASKSDSAPVSENQVVTVQRGNLIIDTTAVGNLALSLKEDLAFDIFYEEATVEEVLVEEGDTVKEGQLLATLDTSEWEDELDTLEDQVTTAERQLTARQRDLVQAEINLKNAEIALEQTQSKDTLSDIKVAQADVDQAKRDLEEALGKLYKYEPGTPGWEAHQKIVIQAGARVNTAEDKLDAILSGFGTEEVAVKKLQVELVQGKLEDAQTAIEDAQKALADAREKLDEAMSYSPVVPAPFDGFITKVNVEGGDEVLNGTVAVQLADPNKFEAEVMVSEMDILQVKLGGKASVQVDAMPVINLPAKVTHISPTATIQSGIVNYTVKVKIESLQAVLRERQKAMPTMIPEDFQLREGLTVTVSILVEERNDVLLVPNRAITRRGRETYVQVLKDGVIEERSIKTGLSDWQYTEVTDGLSEGEQVVVPETTTTSTTQTSPMPLFPGGGRPH